MKLRKENVSAIKVEYIDRKDQVRRARRRLKGDRLSGELASVAGYGFLAPYYSEAP